MYEKYSVFALNQIGRFKPLFEGKGHYHSRCVHRIDI